MASIPDADLERLKQDISVERLVEARGVALKQRGVDRVGLCPFDEDREPSLVVTPVRNLWHCFGCGAGGGVIGWVMKAEGVSFRHAVELLREGLPSLAAFAAGPNSSIGYSTTHSIPVKRSTVRKLVSPLGLDAHDQALLDQVIDYYHATLKQSPDALAIRKNEGSVRRRPSTAFGSITPTGHWACACSARNAAEPKSFRTPSASGPSSNGCSPPWTAPVSPGGGWSSAHLNRGRLRN